MKHRLVLRAPVLGFRAKAHEDLTQTLNELTVLDETIKSARDKVKRTVLRAPVRGIINKFTIATIGAVVSPGENISELVPLDDTLLIEAQIRPQDVAFLFPGQPARVRVTAYDYTVYGDLPGAVERIGADTITNEEGKTYYPGRPENGPKLARVGKQSFTNNSRNGRQRIDLNRR